jgi:hypothetical protein
VKQISKEGEHDHEDQDEFEGWRLYGPSVSSRPGRPARQVNYSELFRTRFAHLPGEANFEGKENTTMKIKTNLKAGGYQHP